MSFELCVNWPGDLNKAKELILKAYSFGYLGIAFNNTLNLVEKCNKLRSSPNKNSVSGNILSILAKEGHVCPIQYIQLEKEELRGMRKRSLIVKSNSGPLVPKNAYLPLSLSCHNFEINKQFGKEDDTSFDFLQLRRLSIVFDNPDCVPYINALSRGPCNESSDSWSKAIFSSVPNQPYDLVSVRPTTQNALNSAISSVECDIISIDISSAPRLPFIIKRPQINLAISRGIFFELDISQCILNKDMFPTKILLLHAIHHFHWILRLLWTYPTFVMYFYRWILIERLKSTHLTLLIIMLLKPLLKEQIDAHLHPLF
uniref:Cgd3_1620 protein n=1 Tax=Cryptosporidium parvum TaxID=5807 RepID=F0X4B7_CRYPV